MSSSGTARLVLRAGVGLAVSAAAVILIGQAIDFEQVRIALVRAGWGSFAAIALLVTIDVAARTMRWRALLRPLKRIPAVVVGAHSLVGYLANNALPARLGEVARSYTLGTREGISKATVVGTVVVERLLDVAVLSLMGLGAIALTPAGGIVRVGITAGIALAGVGAVIAVGAASPSVRHYLSERLQPHRLRSLAAVTVRLGPGLAVVRSRRAVSQAVAWSAGAWLVTAVAFALAGSSVGIDLSPAQVVLFVVATNLVTVIPAGPAYVGTFELAAISVGAGIGIPPAAALAMAVLVHVAIVAVTTVGGIVAVGYLYAVVPRAALAAERLEVQD